VHERGAAGAGGGRVQPGAADEGDGAAAALPSRESRYREPLERAVTVAWLPPWRRVALLARSGGSEPVGGWVSLAYLPQGCLPPAQGVIVAGADPALQPCVVCV
jgi:hypothetical protein